MAQKNIWFHKNDDESHDTVVRIILDILDIRCLLLL